MSGPDAAARGPADAVRTVLVVGTGLLGTSVGLALRAAGVEVFLSDTDPRASAFAADLGAGVDRRPEGVVDVAVVAVDPEATAQVIAALVAAGAARSYTDVASVKAAPREALLALAPEAAEVYCGAHPMAGRERSGPAAARSDLFLGRPWVITPGPETSADARQAARAVALLCGGEPVDMSPEDHDRAVAVVSHVPQLAASLVAAQLVDCADAVPGIAGQGFRDVTRIAASDASLWTAILASNAREVAAVLDGLSRELTRLRAALEALSADPDDDAGRTAVAGVLAAGARGRARVPGKHGRPPVRWDVLPVVIGDEPGALARLLSEADREGVNVEDIGIEHSPGQLVGLVELSVRPGAGAGLAEALRSRGWTVHAGNLED